MILLGFASSPPRRSLGPLILAGAILAAAPADATTLSLPMHDISRQCAAGRRNVNAMSECIVAESEARSEILQKWMRVSDASADRCLKVSKKAKRFPYSELAKCLSVETVEAVPTTAAVAPVVVGTPSPAPTAAPPAAAGTAVAAPAPIAPPQTNAASGFNPGQSLRAFGSKLFGSGK